MDTVKEILFKNDCEKIQVEDFKFNSEKHFYNTCRMLIKDKNIVDVRSIESSLKCIAKAFYDFTVKFIIRLNHRCLIYPTKEFLSSIKLIYDFESLYNIFKDSEKILENYQKLINMEIGDIIIHERYKSYINQKKLLNSSFREVILKDILEKNKVEHCELTEDILAIISDLTNKSGLFKLYDKKKNLVYIDKSYNLAEGILKSSKKKKTCYCSYCIIDNKADTDIYEIYYISKLKPIYNIANIDLPTIKLKELEFGDIIQIYLTNDIENENVLKDEFINFRNNENSIYESAGCDTDDPEPLG